MTCSPSVACRLGLGLGLYQPCETDVNRKRESPARQATIRSRQATGAREPPRENENASCTATSAQPTTGRLVNARKSGQSVAHIPQPLPPIARSTKMLAITPLTRKRKLVTPNLLPTSIKHNGPVDAGKRYWDPTPDSSQEQDGSVNGNSDTSTAYFRGRKLRGRRVKLPDGYEGVVLQKTASLLSEHHHQKEKKTGTTAEQLRRMEEGDDPEEEDRELGEKPVEVKMMEQTASFDEMMVWGHEVVLEGDDVYVKGVREWMAFAETVRIHHVAEIRRHLHCG